jgi:uncharacterized membrane protein
MGKNRLEAFSDGVIAIVITLLVLEIRVPEVKNGLELRAALVHLLPKLAAYVISFLVLAVWWMSHHQLMEQVRTVDRGLLWLNNLFLLSLAFIPFPTALMGEYPAQPDGAVIYGLVCTLAGLSFFAMRTYAGRKPTMLVHQDAAAEIQSLRARSLLSPVLYGSAAVLALWLPAGSMAIFAGIPVYFALARRRGT